MFYTRYLKFLLLSLFTLFLFSIPTTVRADTIQLDFTATLNSEWDSDFIDWLGSDTISGYITYDTDTTGSQADYIDGVTFEFNDSSAVIYIQELDLAFNMLSWTSYNMEGTTSFEINAQTSDSDDYDSLYISLYSSSLLDNLYSLPGTSDYETINIGHLYFENADNDSVSAYPNSTQWEVASVDPSLPAPEVNDANELLLGGDELASGAQINEGDSLTTQKTTVGYEADGKFVQAGGIHETKDLSVGGDPDDSTSANGEYILSGGELTTDTTQIGYQGTGIFTQNGGSHTTRWLMIGNVGYGDEAKAIGFGTYNLSGGTLSTRYAAVGAYGQGTFNQSGGSVAIGYDYNKNYDYESTSRVTKLNIGSSSSLYNPEDIDDEEKRYGAYNLTGGQLTVYASVAVGCGIDISSEKYGGTGYFNQSGGTSTMYNLIVGEEGSTGSGEGHVTVSNDASMNIKNDILVGVASTQAPAKATFIQTGGTVTVDGAIQIGESGENAAANAYRIQGGQTTATGGVYVGTEDADHGEAVLEVSNGGILNADVTIYSQGILKGDGGTIYGDVYVDGGTLAPGNSPGTITIDGDLNLLSGTLEIEISSDASDLLNVLGDLTIGSDLAILLLLDSGTDSLFYESGSYIFDLDDYFNVNGSFTLADDFSIEDSLIIEGLSDGSNITVSIQGNETSYIYNTSAVPVPSAVILLGLAFPCLLGIRRLTAKKE